MSITLATISATATTPAAIAARSQAGMRGYSTDTLRVLESRGALGFLFALERLPSGIALLEAVPVPHFLLAELPAEEDLLALPHGREIDEPGVGILHDRTELVDRVDAAGYTGELVRGLVVKIGEPLGVDAAPIPGDAREQLRASGLHVGESFTVGNEAFCERADSGKKLVGLLGGEVARRHPRMIGEP